MAFARSPDTATDRDSFLAHVQAGGKVEASDWMPDDYRAGVLKFLEMHANSEFMGAMPEREWIPRAPSLMRKLTLTAKVQDEVGHAQILYSLAEDLGKPRAQMLDDLVNGRSKFHNVFHYPVPTWGDVALIGWPVPRRPGALVGGADALLRTTHRPGPRPPDPVPRQDRRQRGPATAIPGALRPPDLVAGIRPPRSDPAAARRRHLAVPAAGLGEAQAGGDQPRTGEPETSGTAPRFLAAASPG